MKPTVILPAVIEPTLEEQIAGLKATAHRLAVERDAAIEERDKANARADVHVAIANTALARLDTAYTEMRRANDQCRELGEANETLTQRLERAQQPRPDDQTTRWPFRRIGNAL